MIIERTTTQTALETRQCTFTHVHPRELQDANRVQKGNGLPECSRCPDSFRLCNSSCPKQNVIDDSSVTWKEQFEVLTTRLYGAYVTWQQTSYNTVCRQLMGNENAHQSITLSPCSSIHLYTCGIVRTISV